MSINESLLNQINYKKSINFLYKQIAIDINDIISRLLPDNNFDNLLQHIEKKIINNSSKINKILLDYLKIYESKCLDELINELSAYEEELYKTGNFTSNNEIPIEYNDKQINDIQVLIYNKLSSNINNKEILPLFNKHLDLTKEINECIIENVITPILEELTNDYKSSCTAYNLQYKFKSQKYYSLFITQLIFSGYPLTQEQFDVVINGISIEAIYENLKGEVINNAKILQNKFKIDDNWKQLNKITQKLYTNEHEYITMYILSQLKKEHYDAILPRIIEKIHLDFKNITPNKKAKTLKEYISSIYKYVLNNKYNVLSTIVILLSACAIYNQHNKYNKLKDDFLNLDKENEEQDKLIIKLKREELKNKGEIQKLNNTKYNLLDKTYLLEKREKKLTEMLTNLYVDHDNLIKSNRDIKNSIDSIFKK